MTAILDSLRDDHRNMTGLLDLLGDEVKILGDGGEADFDLMVLAIDYCLTYPDLYHHPKEDQVYRRLVEKGISQFQVSDMVKTHEDLAGLTRRLAAALDGLIKAPEGARDELVELAVSFLDAYRRHMEAEDMVFFPLAEERLTPADWASIESEMARVNDPLFGERAAAAYRRLNRDLIARGGRQAAGG